MIIKKIVAPSKLCCEPYLTEWHANLESGMQIWIQTSEDETNPKWIRFGDLYEMSVLKYRSDYPEEMPEVFFSFNLAVYEFDTALKNKNFPS